MRSCVAVVIAIATLASSCTSTSTTSTDPSPVKCQVTLTPSTLSLDAGGGTGSVTVSAQQECGWSASVDNGVSWITIVSSTSGQGSGKVDFRAAANSDPSARHGTITVNSQKVTIDQAAAACVINIATSSQTVAATGGTGSVGVSAGPGCAWTAVSNADWISITSGASGTGDGSVGFTVAANPGDSRTGTLTIAGHTFTVAQSAVPPPSCTFSLSSASQSVGTAGGSGTVAVTAGPTCPWTAASNVPWISVTGGATGSGNGMVSFNVSANTGDPRTGTLTIAGQTFTVTQAGVSTSTCTYSLTPGNPSAPAGGGPVSVQLTTQPTCSWIAGSNAPWITNVAPTAGTGNANIQFTVGANTGPQRTGGVAIADKIVSVTQASGCSYGIAPSSHSFPVGGGSGGPVTVTAGGGCGWNAASNATWITNVSPGSGSGGGMVTFTVAANTGIQRTGTLTIAGQTFTATQDACTYHLSPTSQSVPHTGGAQPAISVVPNGGCASPWTTTLDTGSTWIHISGSGSGSGAGTVSYTVDATIIARTGGMTIAGQHFAVMQSLIP